VRIKATINDDSLNFKTILFRQPFLLITNILWSRP